MQARYIISSILIIVATVFGESVIRGFTVYSPVPTMLGLPKILMGIIKFGSWAQNHHIGEFEFGTWWFGVPAYV